MSDIQITLRPSGHKELDRFLKKMRLGIKDHQKATRKIAGLVRTDAKKNIREQKTVGGQSFAKRKDMRKKGKMLAKLGKTVDVVSCAGQGGGTAVTWKNGLVAGIAGRHQWGDAENWTAQKLQKLRGSLKYKEPCTERQAKALVAIGYREHRKGKPAKKLRKKEIMERYNKGRAGVILRYLRTGSVKGKQTWEVRVPKRPFLGVTDAKAKEYMQQLALMLGGASTR